MALIRAHGVAVTPPKGWEAQLRTLDPAGDPAGRRGSGAEPQASAAPVTRSRTAPPRINLHVGNFPLPRQRGDFGSGAVEAMGFRHAFVSLVEYDQASAGTALFAHEGFPGPLRPRDFDPAALQRTITGQAGLQRFFTASGRAFCLYVVIGSHRMNQVLTPAINEVVSTIEVD